jgi:5-formyltetrahydrofolate cyclo-ligase
MRIFDLFIAFLLGFGIAAEKEVLRQRILQLRDNMDPADIRQKSLKIKETVLGLPEYAKADVIASYVNKGSEVETKLLIRKALASRKKVLIPMTQSNTRELLYSEISSLDNLVLGRFGIPEPRHVKIRDLATAKLVFVPGVVWDIYGYRLGWGKGYFDTVLSHLSDSSLSIGLSFDLQLVEQVPREQFDLPVKMLVTESRVIQYNA